MSPWRPRTVRTRLAIGYAVAVGLAIVLYGAIVYLVFQDALFEQMRVRLHDDFEAIEYSIEETPGGGLRWKDEGRHEEGHVSEAAWVEVTAPDGTVVLRRPERTDPAEAPFRTYRGTYRAGDRVYRVTTGRSDRSVRRELRALLRTQAIALLPAVLLAFFGGRWLARRALRPVERMTERARAITADRLSERLPAERPDDELGRLAGAFNDLFARLETSFERLRRFTADASHELRTPLTAIRAVGEVGPHDPRDAAAWREVVGSMLEEADRLTQLVDGLLTLSRADAGVRLARTPTDLAALARATAARLAVLAEEKGQTVQVDAPSPVSRDVDPMVLGQALTNLVDNAIKYGPEGSRVTVTVAEHDGDAVLAVRDEGPGIAAEHLPHVFERFYRADPARSGGGTGLGLAIARWAVEVHGGRIDVESREGAGSTFRIVLPRAGGGRLTP